MSYEWYGSADVIVELYLSECQRNARRPLLLPGGSPPRTRPAGGSRRIDPPASGDQLSLLPVLRSFGSGSVAGASGFSSSSARSAAGSGDGGTSSGGDSASERTWLP